MQRLTQAQHEYFQNTCMKTKDDTMLVCYHRTNHEFDTFDKSKIGTSKDIGWLGQGFYFTTDNNYSKEYGENEYKCYLNITNPFIINQATYEEKVEIMDYLRANHPNYGKENGPIELALQPSEEQHELTPKEFNGGFFFAGMWQDYSAQFTEYVKSKGYDGILMDTPESGVVFEIVVFEPNQIKLTTNLYPTKDDNFVDNSREYLRENWGKLSNQERTEIAKLIAQQTKKQINRSNRQVER